MYQYITQRALGSDLKPPYWYFICRLMKLAMPVIVILPGIAAYVLIKNGANLSINGPNGHVIGDNAYSQYLAFANGLKGRRWRHLPLYCSLTCR